MNQYDCERSNTLGRAASGVNAICPHISSALPISWCCHVTTHAFRMGAPASGAVVRFSQRKRNNLNPLSVAWLIRPLKKCKVSPLSSNRFKCWSPDMIHFVHVLASQATLRVAHNHCNSGSYNFFKSLSGDPPHEQQQIDTVDQSSIWDIFVQF